MAEISETKTPQAGEYWVSDDGSLIRIVGTKLNGSVIYENQAGLSFQFNSMTNWRHEPRCTSFHWVEPKLLTPGEGYEWVQQDDMIASGDEYRKCWAKGWHSTSAVGTKCKSINTYRRKIKPVESPNDWVGCTGFDWVEPCAMCGDVSCDCDCYRYAVEATGCPVESPDDWVEITDPEHVIRAIDQVNARGNGDGGWSAAHSSIGSMVKDNEYLIVRCRRKDLPVPMTRQSVAEVCTSEPVKTPNVVTWGGTVPSAKRVPVRLFLDDRNNMFAVRGEWPIIVGTQIKHDANGFYLEGEE